MIERRAGGTTVQETPTSRAASPCGRARLALVHAHPPAVAAETLPAGGRSAARAAAFTRRAICDSDSQNTFSSLPASTATS